MEKKIKVLLADNSEAFGIPARRPCVRTAWMSKPWKKTDGRLWTRSPISNPMW